MNTLLSYIFMRTIVIVFFFVFTICILHAQNSDSKIEKVAFDSTTIEQINTDSYPCVTCEIIQSIFNKELYEVETKNPANYTEEERIISNKLYNFMIITLKDILFRLSDSTFRKKTQIKDELWGLDKNVYNNIIKNQIQDLELFLKEISVKNLEINSYFLMFLYALKNCPNQLIVAYDISEPSHYFSFHSMEDISYFYLYTHDNEPFINYSVDGFHFFDYKILSHYSLGKNYTAPCNRAYSIYKWDKSDLQSQRWIRMK